MRDHKEEEFIDKEEEGGTCAQEGGALLGDGSWKRSGNFNIALKDNLDNFAGTREAED